MGSDSKPLSLLVLSRLTGEDILIGDDIVIHVVSILGDRVRIGVQAPKHIRVDRREVRERIDNKSHGGVW